MTFKSIKQLRKRLKLTQNAAAALVRVTPNTWARWERGESKPRGLHQRRAITLLPRLARGGAASLPPRSLSPRNSANADLRRRSTAGSLLKYAGTWAGDDLERCLKEVYATRSKAEF